MTWIPCGMCNQCPCVCHSTYRPMPYTFTSTPNLTTPRLSDDDVERIAKRVAELLRDELRLRQTKNETSHGLRIGDVPLPGDIR